MALRYTVSTSGGSSAVAQIDIIVGNERPGDLNNDRRVNADDLAVLLAHLDR